MKFSSNFFMNYTYLYCFGGIPQLTVTIYKAHTTGNLELAVSSNLHHGVGLVTTYHSFNVSRSCGANAAWGHGNDGARVTRMEGWMNVCLRL